MPTGEPLVLVATTDDGPCAESLTAGLTAMGCHVIAVTGIIDAIAELHGFEFDIAFIAHSLPRSCADAVRVAQKLSPDTEVVVVLDDGREDAPVEFVRLGAFDFLHQPLRTEELHAVVKRALERRAERTTNAIYRASHAILSGTAPDQLPRVIVSLAADVLEADGVAFFRFVGDRFELGERSGFAREEAAADFAVMIERLRHHHHVPLLLPDDRDPGLFANTRIRSAIAVPIVIDGHLAGILGASRSADPRPFRRGDAKRISVFASQLRLAIENARLIEKTVATERLAAVGELAAGVAHEIANPLTYVLGNAISAADELKRPHIDLVELAAMLGDIKDGAERIRDIARDLRTLSRGTSDRETFELSDTVRSALRIAGPAIRGTLKVETNLDPSALVCGSPGRLSQMFINLFVNAAQAAKATSRTVTLEVETRCEDDHVIAVVRDEGPGIPPHIMNRIFDAFFTTKTSESGTGLGLSISRSIVEAHGGTIDVASEPGRGTTFTVMLPLAVTAAPSRVAAA